MCESYIVNYLERRGYNKRLNKYIRSGILSYLNKEFKDEINSDVLNIINIQMVYFDKIVEGDGHHTSNSQGLYFYSIGVDFKFIINEDECHNDKYEMFNYANNIIDEFVDMMYYKVEEFFDINNLDVAINKNYVVVEELKIEKA